jgi:hypothetical protein
LAVDLYAAGTDDFTELDAAVLGQRVGEIGVEPLAGSFGLDG